MHEARHAGGFGAGFGGFGAVAGDDHHRGPRLTRLDLFGHLEPAHSGHADVGIDEVVFFLVQLAQRLFAVFGGDDGVTFAGQNPVEALADGGIVVDDEDFA